ncbi:MAG: hypothetical protein J6P54_09315 [Bacteroidales bacterium]|nr:hypothetical protein [Bacteroidales bacterium]
MKRTLITATMIISTIIAASGQTQTPSDIAKKWKEIQACCDKYDDGSDSAYRMINEQIARTQRDPVANAIWHSCMAQFLSDYYSSNRYRLGQRTEVADETPADYKEWDARTFDCRIREEYLASLKNADATQRVVATSYSAIVENTRDVRPEHTLYDILAQRTLSYLRSKLKSDDNPAPSLRQDPALWDSDAFLNVPLSLSDTNDNVTNILFVYQSLEKYHDKQHHETLRTNYLLERFDFMRLRGLTPDNSLTWYIELLTRYGETCADKEAYGYVAYKLGTLYADRSDDYDAELHPEFRNDLVTAAEYLKASLQKASPKAKSPDYEYDAKELLKKIQNRVLQIRPQYLAFPTESPLLVDVEYKDVTKAYIRLIPISNTTFEQVTAKGIFDYFGNVISIKPSFQETVDLPDFQDHRKHVGHYIIPRQKVGGYILIISSKPVLKTYKDCDEIVYIQVSDIHIVVRDQDQQIEYMVVNRQTGEPLENATITYTTGKSTKRTLKTDRNGMATTNKANGRSYHSDVVVEWNKQVLHLTGTNYLWTRSQEEKTITQCDLFLDRKLYRPGQTVYFKGIVSETVTSHGETRQIQLKPYQEVTVHLYDANDQEIDVKTLTTNDFGSVSGTFDLPADGLTGRFTIQVKINGKEYIGANYFSVEEYKRPTFEVTLNAPAEAVKVGQTVTVKGTAEALSGYPIDGAAVSYKVTRRTEFPWWRYRCPSSDSRTILTGTTETDADGSFTIAFPTEEDLALKRYTPLYVYDVEAVVTDINGETHTETSTVRVSRRSLQLAVSLPEEIELSETDNMFSVSLKNISDVPQNGEILYEIYQLKTPDRYYFPVSEADATLMPLAQLQENFPNLDFQHESQQEKWDSVRIATGTISCSATSQNSFSFPHLAGLPKGYYRVKFKAQDPSGDWIEVERTTHLYSKKENQCSGYKQLWHDFNQNNPLYSLGKAGYSIDAGETLKFSFGTYLDHARVLCEIAHNDSVVFAKWYELRNKTVSIALPTKQTDRGTLSVHLYMMAENNTFEITPNIKIVNHLQDIRFEFLRFRDKTLPGSQEELQVRLTDKDGKPISAELLCSMYDYSLDVLGGQNYLNLVYDYQHNQRNLRFGRTLTPGTYMWNSGYFNTVPFHSPQFFSPYIDLQSFYCGSYRRYAKGGVVLNMVEDNISVEEDVQFEEVVEAEPAVVFVDDMMAQEASQKEAAKLGNTPSEPQIRTNFNETAFFYPQLRTDANGEIFFSFTMPDALTKWKMQGVAHNPDLQYGRFEKFMQTRKDLMIVPNAPRFLREGDTMDFSAKLVNTSDKHLCGYVTLDFFNAVNNQPVAMICDDGANANDRRDAINRVSTSGHVQYDVAPGISQEVHFRIVVPEDAPAVTYRIIARNTDPQDVAGDGEEKTLPVLTNRMMVTESMPFYISGKGSKTFTFNKFRDSFGVADGRDAINRVSTTLKHYRLTVECTPNPVWYAIQAMPYMMEYPHECNEQRFSRYYANALATHILKSNPVIEEVFNRWQVESPDAFCSALEKNSDLKQIVLEETPWVLDAQREGANKQALAAMFDFKRMAKEEASTLRKLQQAQNGDGGWPWFAGGKSSDFITRHIVAGFGHLKALGVNVDVANSTLRNAVSYMDEQMYKRYLDRKKYHYDYVNETHYLYARSFYKDKVSAKHKVAYDTCYKALLRGWKSESFYTQAMIALTAWRNGDQKVAREIVAYLKSMAQHSEEMGMFWKKQGRGWFWYEQPVERQSMLIEAFYTITPEDVESLAQMQLWLLKQKQTQNWGTTKSTTEAIYALLLNKTLVAEDKTVEVTVGDVRLPDESTQTEAGTGYFKKAWSGEEITADKANVRIEKGTDGPAWGGLYWQYFENLDKITRSDDKNLVIEKQIFKVENTDKGEVLKAITENHPLQKGDKLRVRVVITVDRDMEFVHLKDMRAAAFEPVNVFSQYKYQDGLWYYEATKDAATHFFIDWLPKGKYVFEYTLFATQSGNFSNGITEIECMYAPEFRSHSGGVRVNIVR